MKVKKIIMTQLNRTCPMSVASTLDTNKYKLLMKIAIEDLDIIKGKNLFEHNLKEENSFHIF